MSRPPTHPSLQVDVWAVGILAYELLEGFCPFESVTRKETCNLIMTSEPRFPAWMSDSAVSFIRTALSKVCT